MYRRLIASLALILINSAAVAGWTVDVQKDPMNDSENVYAQVKNAQALLYLYESDNGFMGAFSPLKRFQQIHYEPKQVVLRVDSNKSYTLRTVSWEPKRVFFQLPIELVDELVSGSGLKLQYPTTRNARKVESFSLEGSSAAIERAYSSYEHKEMRAERQRQAQLKMREREKREQEEEAARAAEQSLPLDERVKVIRARLEAAKPKKTAYYNEHCPEEWAEVIRLEAESGRPQMFRGCSGD